MLGAAGVANKCDELAGGGAEAPNQEDEIPLGSMLVLLLLLLESTACVELECDVSSACDRQLGRGHSVVGLQSDGRTSRTSRAAQKHVVAGIVSWTGLDWDYGFIGSGSGSGEEKRHGIGRYNRRMGVILSVFVGRGEGDRRSGVDVRDAAETGGYLGRYNL